jgi:hypothetical protein
MKVLQCVRATDPEAINNPQNTAHIDALIKWYRNVVGQVRFASPDDPSDTSGLPKQVQVWTWQQGIEADMRKNLRSDGLLDESAARAVMEGLLVAFMHNYIPAMRLNIVMSMQVPEGPITTSGGASTSSGGGGGRRCNDPDCKRQGCKGNRLEVLELWYGGVVLPLFPPPAPSPTEGPIRVNSLFVVPTPAPPPKIKIIKAVVVHHKTDKHDKMPIMFNLPEALSALVHGYLAKAHPVVTAGASGNDKSLLFVTPKGKAYNNQSLENLWLTIQEKLEAPWPPFTPRMNRHIHAAHCWEKMLQQVGHLPVAEGAQGHQLIMGNSSRAWASNYVPEHRSMACEAALAQIAAWKAGLAQAAIAGAAAAAEAAAAQQE